MAKIEVGAEGAVGMAWSGKGDTVLVWSAHKVSGLYPIVDTSLMSMRCS